MLKKILYLLVLVHISLYAYSEKEYLDINGKIGKGTQYLLEKDFKNALFYFDKEKNEGYTYPFQNSQMAYCFYKTNKYVMSIIYSKMFLKQKFNDKKYMDIVFNKNKNRIEEYLSHEIKKVMLLEAYSNNKIGRYKYTIEYINKNIELFQKTKYLVRVYYALGFAYEKLKIYEESMKYYQKIQLLLNFGYYKED